MGSPSSTRLTKRIILWVLISIILVGAFLGLSVLGRNFSSDILFQLVKRETNDHYLLSYKEIDIDLWKRTIKLKEVLLKPDPDKDYQGTGLNNLYELEMAGLNIDLKSIISIYTVRQLHIKNIRIIDPQIHIKSKKGNSDETFSLQTGNLYKEISDYLRVLQIDIFKIENAAVKHSPSGFGLDSIDFFISNLLIDSASRPDKRFYSENIELEIRNQSFLLKDSIHQITFDRFLLSTADSILTFQNLVLKPLANVLDTINKLDDKTIYDITIPTLRLKGVDYFSAYRYNYLEMEELSLTDSYIFLEEQTQGRNDQPAKKGNSLLEQLMTVFDGIRIGKMRFINANLNLKTNDDYNHNYQHVQSERADIVLYNFYLDSTNYQLDFGKKYFDNVDINIKDYRSFLPDSIHTIQFDLLKLSSIDSSLIFKNFNISNNGNGTASDMFLSIDVPQVRLSGLNYSDILINRQLIVRDLLLQNPNVVFESRQKKWDQQDFTPDSLYRLIKDHFKVIGVKKLQVRQGEFSINRLLSFNQTDFSVSNFNIPHVSNSWYDVLNDLELEIHNMVLDDEAIRLKGSHLILDRLASRLTIEDLRFAYLDPHTSASGDLKNLLISGIDLDRFSTGNYFAFDSLRLTNPTVAFEMLKPRQEGLINNFTTSKFIEIINGELNVKTYDSASFSLNRINTKLSAGTLTNIQLGEASNLTFTLPNKSNKLNISDIKLFNSQELYLKNIRLQPIKDTLLQKVELTAQIPAMTLHGIDQNRLWQQKVLAGDSLIVDTPDLTLQLNKIATAFTVADSLEVQFQKIVLDKARVMYSDDRQPEIKMIKMPRLSVTLEGFQYPENPILSTHHLLYADYVTLHVQQIQPVLANGDFLLIHQLDFSQKEARILIDTLRYEAANQVTSTLFPGIEIIGLDLDAYINKKQLKLDNLELIAPQITHDLGASNRNQQDLSRLLPESIDVGYFSSISTEIAFNDRSKSTSYTIHKGNVELHNFYADGELNRDQFFEYVQFASIRGQDFLVPLGDGYQLSVGRYHLQHPKNTLTLNDINITSEYSPAEYTKRLTYQKDWFDVSADGVIISGLDLDRAFSKRQYKAEKLLVDGLNALIYRDKSVPLNTSAVKELPQGMLRNINHWVYLDTLNVVGNITHQINPVNTEELAELSFNALNASLFRITTVDQMPSRPMRLVSSGILADTAHFEAYATFNMQDQGNQFSFSGQIDQMPLSALNKLLRPLANINIKEGYAEEISFSMNGNNEIATGEMNFRYNDLKIQILNPETNDMQGLNQEIKTFFANTFVIRQNNPTFIVLKPGTIFQRRDPSRVIFHYWGEALLSGAVSSIGINKSKKDIRRYDKEMEDVNR
tara:strand:+ start:51488 stop:55555 length:4068 start_codon:yes stop_codon:yes gene_type:complete